MTSGVGEDPDETRWRDFPDPDEADPVGWWRHRIAELERAGRHEEAARQRENGPPLTLGPNEYAYSPKILAVEIGGDPGGALGVAHAVLRTPTMRLVVAIGPAESARFTRHLLDLLGRPDIGVVAGHGPSTQDVAIAGLTPPAVPTASGDLTGAVSWVAESYPYVILWGNSGPLTDLATVLTVRPDVAERLSATIAAGPPGTAPASFAADPVAAATAIRLIQRPSRQFQDPRATAYRPHYPTLISADPQLHVLGPGSELRRVLGDPAAPPWATLLHAHIDQWFTLGHDTFSAYPMLVASELIGRSRLRQHRNRDVVVDASGQLLEQDGGTHVMLTARNETSTSFDYFTRYFTTPTSELNRT